ncbi:MAG: glycoside hydrolase family 3 C-terminal domain-containing protein [Alistipes sp.]|nr:glycoside hydrolase family 3 C-terminal domain-containing protein [Alistipes sp.]
MKRLPIFITAVALFCGVAVAEELKLREDNIPQIVGAMTLQEKAQLVVGADMKEINFAGEVGDTQHIVPGAAGITFPIPRLGIPSIVMADGPAGLRIKPTREGDPNTYYCTGFPVGTHLAATWNDDIIYRVGQAMGNEVKEYGVDILLAPGVNIMRNPLCGRNFEYYSEDPLLAGKTAAAIINGVESQDVGTSLKHFCANNQEINRLANDARISQRALREIYLRNFEIAVREAQPWTIMTSYNYLNGRYTSEDKGLLEDVLRGEFGFQGMIVTDWGGGLDPAAQMAAGNDMIQPGEKEHIGMIMDAVKNGSLKEADLDKCVTRILELIVKTPRFKGYKFSNKPDLKAHAAVTREVASEGFVLLKNDNATLPMAVSQKVALFGVGSYDFIAGGRGSGDVNKAYVVDMHEGMTSNGIVLDKKLDDYYLQHMAKERKRIAPLDEHRRWTHYTLRPNEVKDPRQLVEGSAERADIAVITFSRHSAEGFDRHVERDFNLRIDETALLNEVSRQFRAAGKKVVVVLNISGPVEVASWRDKVDAILVCWMPGQEGGNSVADALLGKVSPSGHLPMSFPMSYADVPSQNFPVNVPETGLNQSYENYSTKYKYYDQPNIDYTNYTEDIFVGYRHFSTRKVAVAYPFGHGLTYSDFELSDMKLRRQNEQITVSCRVKNVGSREAKQVVQLYSTALYPDHERPLVELRGYSKTPLLQPGQSCEVTIAISDHDLAIFSEQESAWKTVAGDYRLSLGFSCEDLRCYKELFIPQTTTRKVTDVLKPTDGKLYIE